MFPLSDSKSDLHRPFAVLVAIEPGESEFENAERDHAEDEIEHWFLHEKGCQNWRPEVGLPVQ